MENVECSEHWHAHDPVLLVVEHSFLSEQRNAPAVAAVVHVAAAFHHQLHLLLETADHKLLDWEVDVKIHIWIAPTAELAVFDLTQRQTERPHQFAQVTGANVNECRPRVENQR